MARSRVPQTPKPKLPITTTQPNAAFVRMTNRKLGALSLFYSTEKAEWVIDGYTVWNIDTWNGSFGRQKLVYSPDGKSCVDSENRHWEFFGYTIPLYNDEDEQAS